MKKTKFKETEIGKVPEEWDLLSIDEIGEVVGGGTPSTKVQEFWDGDIAWLTPRDLSNCNLRYVSRGERNISRKGLEKSSAKILPPNSVLLTTRAPVGYVAIARNDISTNQGFRSVIPKKGVSSEYLYYLLKNNTYYLKSHASGTTFGELAGSTLKSLKFAFPDFDEQKSIAKILSDLDLKIELNHRINKNLESIGQALFKCWFVDFDFPDEEGKPYKSSGGEMVDSELGEIPKGWTVIENISEICEKINYGYTQSASEKIVGPKFLRVTDINKGDWINWNNVPYCEIDDKDLTKYILKKMDIVITRMADPGKIAIFESDMQVVFASYLIRIRFKNPLQAYYLYYLMKSRYYQNYILGASTGTVQKSLNAKGLTNGLSIVIPDEAILRKFNDVIILLREKINTNLSENKNLSRIRDSLLPRLMSGRSRVSIG